MKVKDDARVPRSIASQETRKTWEGGRKSFVASGGLSKSSKTMDAITIERQISESIYTLS